MSAKYRNLLAVVALFFCSMILFTWGLSAQEVFGFDSRFYFFVKEMWQYGTSWFPMTYHHPYPDYPATSTVLIYLFALLLGGINKFVVVLPSAILAASTLTFTYLIGALHHKRWGLYAVLFMLLTITFLKSARSISLDMYPTLITACCFYLIYTADRKCKPLRVWWIYPLLILSFAFRGPIGLVIPAGVICSYYLLNGQLRKLFFIGLILSLLLIVCTGILLALSYQVGGETFMQRVLCMEVLGRINNHYLSRYFYFIDSVGSYALVFPLSWFVLFGVFFYFFTARDYFSEIRLLLKLFGWMMVILVGMSIPDDKKIRYILPMLPAVALIAAYPFVAPSSQKYFIVIRWILLRTFLLFPLIFLVATTYVSLYVKWHLLNIHFNYLYLNFFYVITQVINILIFYHIDRESIFDIGLSHYCKRTLCETAILCIAVLIFAITYIAVIEPIQLYIDRARDFVVAVEAQRIQQHARLVFYKERPDGLPIKYMINMKSTDQPLFVRNQNDLITFSAPAYFVASESYFNDLSKHIAAHFHVIAKDTLGHVKVVVFTRSEGVPPIVI